MARQPQRTAINQTATRKNGYKCVHPRIAHGDRVILNIAKVMPVADSAAEKSRKNIYFDTDQLSATTLASLLDNRQKIINMLLESDLVAEVLGKAAGRRNYNVRVTVGDKIFDALFGEIELTRYVAEGTEDPEAI